VVNAVQWITGQNSGTLDPLPDRASVEDDPVEIAAIVLMAITLCFIFTFFPARTASRTDPVQVLRYE
jgi:ABC-type lipoprotein release transport system permease subunit